MKVSKPVVVGIAISVSLGMATLALIATRAPHQKSKPSGLTEICPGCNPEGPVSESLTLASMGQDTSPPAQYAFLVYAGQKYTFSTGSADNPVDSGSLTATWGKVSSKGEYTAPTYRLPYGEDEIDYSLSDGTSGVIYINVAPNPHLPSSSIAKWLAPTGNTDAASGLPIYKVMFENGTAGLSGTLDQLGSSGGLDKLPILPDANAVPPAQDTLVDCVHVSATLQPDGSYLVTVPAAVQSTGITSQIALAKLSGPAVKSLIPQIGKRGPRNANFSRKPCSSLGSPNHSGLYIRSGPITQKRISTNLSSGLIRLDSSAAKQIKTTFGISLNASAEYSLHRANTLLAASQNYDVYKQINNRLVWLYTKTSQWDELDQWDSPAWCIFVDSAGSTSQNPLVQPGPQNCTSWGPGN